MDRPRFAESMEASTSSEQTWVRGKLLGSGSYGRVNLALDSSTGDLFAVKSVDVTEDTPQSRMNLKALENEVKFLHALSSPYIIRHMGDSWSTEEKDGQKRVYRNLHLELAAGGSLAALVKAAGHKGLGVSLVKRYSSDLVQALSYLHAKGIAHGDVKCLNLLVGANCAKLADFGTCFSINALSEQIKGLKGSPSWMSPETVKEQECSSTAVDVWSLGCTVLEMATGKAPWSEVDGGVYGILYALGCTDSLPHVPDTLAPELRDFILSCLRRDPKERPTAAQLLAHPFLAHAPAGLTVECNAEDIPVPEALQSPVSTVSSFQSHRSCDSSPLHGPCPLSRFSRKRRALCLEESSVPASEAEPIAPLKAATRSRSGILLEMAAKKLKQTAPSQPSHPGIPGSEEDSVTPSFPILDMAFLKGSKPWCFADLGAWPQSPLSSSGSNWIVVRSPSASSSPR